METCIGIPIQLLKRETNIMKLYLSFSLRGQVRDNIAYQYTVYISVRRLVYVVVEVVLIYLCKNEIESSGVIEQTSHSFSLHTRWPSVELTQEKEDIH